MVSRQLSFAGLAPAPPTDRLFFAIYPDMEAATRISRLAQRLRAEHGLKGSPLAPERFHITLHHLGDYLGVPQDIVAAAGEAAKLALPSPFEAAFDHVESFSGRPNNRPFVLLGGAGLDKVTAFQRELGVAMVKAGLGRHAESKFTPHVTLLYDDRIVAGQAVETIAWTAREFVLVHSLLGRTQHVPLARWSLTG